MSDIEQRRAAALKWWNLRLGAGGMTDEKTRNDALNTIEELLQPSPRVKHAMHPSEISMEDLNSIANAEVPVAAGPFEKSVPDGLDEITNEKELQRVADGEVDEAIERSIDVLYESSRIKIYESIGTVDTTDTKQISAIARKLSLSIKELLKEAAQQPRQECPHNCPHCYAIEVRNNLPSPPQYAATHKDIEDIKTIRTALQRSAELDALRDYLRTEYSGHEHNDVLASVKKLVALKRSAKQRANKIDGLVKALEFYADKDNWDKGTIRPPSGQYQQWMMAGCDKGNQAREALQQFNAKEG